MLEFHASLKHFSLWGINKSKMVIELLEGIHFVVSLEAMSLGMKTTAFRATHLRMLMFWLGSNLVTVSQCTNCIAVSFFNGYIKERGEHVPLEESFEVARKVKEMYCYTSSDTIKEFNKHDKEPAKYIKQWRGTKPKTGAPYSCDIGYERFLGPEVFFNLEIYSSNLATPLPDLIDKCIQSTPIDTRRALYKNIVLSGGSTMFKDFHRRLQRDLKKIADTRVLASDARLGGEVKAQPIEVNVASHPIQRYAVWFGGSVLASTPEFFTACHTKAEYEEYGARICRTNPVFKGMYGCEDLIQIEMLKTFKDETGKET